MLKVSHKLSFEMFCHFILLSCLRMKKKIDFPNLHSILSFSPEDFRSTPTSMLISLLLPGHVTLIVVHAGFMNVVDLYYRLIRVNVP